MQVLIPSPLVSYTNAKKHVEATGSTLLELLSDLERQYPGVRFRIVDEQGKMRPHMRFFINGDQVFDLQRSLAPTDSVALVQALSGG
jgi:sulfur-carrier protein